jgi:hypothetical protein
MVKSPARSSSHVLWVIFIVLVLVWRSLVGADETKGFPARFGCGGLQAAVFHMLDLTISWPAPCMIPVGQVRAHE